MGSNVSSVPTDPNMGAAQSGAVNTIQGMGAYTPEIQSAYYNQANNPYTTGAIQGAQAGGQAMQSQGYQNVNTANYLSNVPQQLNPAVMATLNTAYDPQNALYASESQHNMDQSNAQLAQAGLSYTPWASGVLADSNQSFNTNWEATQLGREQTGANTVASLLGAGGTAATTGAQLGQTGATQIAQGGAMPYTTQTGINTDTANMLPYLTSNQQQQAQDYTAYYNAANANTANATAAGQANNSYATNIGSGVGSMATLAAMMYLSDERVKEDIIPIGKTFDGQTIYRYRLLGDPRTQIGLLAGEVEKVHPEAVGYLPSGLRMVNYDLATRKAVRS